MRPTTWPQPQRTDLLIVELTSLCNLNCVYCSVSHPDYRGSNISLSVDAIIQIANQVGCKKIQLHLHGESTIIKNWVEIADKLLAQGYQVHLLSNLAKDFSQKEIEVLAQIVLSLSIDTLDPHVFKKLRRGSEIGTVLVNLFRIQSERRARGIHRELKWNVVLCQETIDTTYELVEIGVALGVTHFYFCNLSEIEGLEGATSLWKTRESMESSQETLGKVVQFLIQKNIPFEFAGFGQQIQQLISSIQGQQRRVRAHEGLRPQHPFQKSPVVSYFQPVQEGETRLCFDPWKRVVIHSDLGVGLCERMAPIGSLKDQPVSDIVRGEQAEKFRKGLFHGPLEKECVTCSKRKSVAQEEFHSQLSQALRE